MTITAVNVRVDETAGQQDDDAILALPAAFSGAIPAGFVHEAVSVSNVLTLTGTIVDIAFTDSAGQPLDGDPSGFQTLAGDDIFLYTGANNNVLLGRTSGGTVVFAGYLEEEGSPPTGAKLWLVSFQPLKHPDADNPDDTLDLSGLVFVTANSEQTFSLDGAPSGQNLFLMMGDAVSAVVVTGLDPANESDGENLSTGDTVNTSQAGSNPTVFGTNNQMIVPTKGMYFTFVEGAVSGLTIPNLTHDEAGEESNIQFTDLNLESAATFTVVQLQGGKSAVVKITASNTPVATGDAFIDGIANNTPVVLDGVSVEDGSGTVIERIGTALGGVVDSAGISITLAADGKSATIEGVKAGYTITYHSATTHSRLLVENAGSGKGQASASFDIGGFQLLQGEQGTEEIGSHMLFDDDGPTNFTPTAVVIDNTGTDVGTENLGTAGKVGSDTVGAAVKFVDGNVTDNYLYGTDGVTALTSGGAKIVLSGFGTTTLLAQTEGTNLTVFTATLNLATNQYTIDFDRTLDDGSVPTSLLGAAPVKSGNPMFNLIDNVAGTDLDLLFSAALNGAPASVNVSTNGAGSGNQTMNTGEMLRIDFVNNGALAGSPNGSDFVPGTHETVNDYAVLISQNTTGATAATIMVKAYDADDDKVLAGDPDDPEVNITEVAVNGTVIFGTGAVASVVVNGHTVTAQDFGNGVIVQGLNEGQSGDGAGGDDPMLTISTATGFNRVEMTNYRGQTVGGNVLPGGDFDLAPAGIFQGTPGTQLGFNLPVQLADADGDTTGVALIGVTVDPVPI